MSFRNAERADDAAKFSGGVVHGSSLNIDPNGRAILAAQPEVEGLGISADLGFKELLGRGYFFGENIVEGRFSGQLGGSSSENFSHAVTGESGIRLCVDDPDAVEIVFHEVCLSES